MLKIAIYTNGEVIGDGVIKLRFIEALRRAMPEAQLTWVITASTVYESVLKTMVAGKLDEILHLPFMKIKWHDVFGKTPDVLQGRHFDLVIDTQKNVMRTLWMKRHAKHDVFVTSVLPALLSDKRGEKCTSTQVFDQLMALGSLAAGKPLESQPLTLPSDAWIKSVREILPEGAQYIGFVPGAGQDYKRWPFEHYITLAQRVQNRGFKPVFILGPMENDFETRIRAALPDAIIPHRMAGAHTNVSAPEFTMAVGQVLEAAVANDSGGGHLIAAGDVPMVSLFRSASVKNKFLPATSRCIGLSPDMFGGSLVSDIPMSAVSGALDELLV